MLELHHKCLKRLSSSFTYALKQRRHGSLSSW